MSAGRHILESVETMLGEPNQYEILRIQASELHRERDLSKERSLRSMMKLWTEEQIVTSIVAAGFAAGGQRKRVLPAAAGRGDLTPKPD